MKTKIMHHVSDSIVFEKYNQKLPHFKIVPCDVIITLELLTQKLHLQIHKAQ